MSSFHDLPADMQEKLRSTLGGEAVEKLSQLQAAAATAPPPPPPSEKKKANVIDAASKAMVHRSWQKKGGIFVDEQYCYFPELPLPEYDSARAQAFTARDTKFPEANLFALMCKGDLGVRMDLINEFLRHPKMNCLTPHAAAVCWNPKIGARRLILIFNLPSGPKFSSKTNYTFTPWLEHQIVQGFLRPMAELLESLSRRSLSLGNIRMENLYFADVSQTKIILGDCFSEPKGLSQNAAYLPIDSAMAGPYGRSGSTILDDIYALGVICVFLFSGKNTLAKQNTNQIISSKINRGSYLTLARGRQFSARMTNALRGMLNDTPKKRWTLQNLTAWLQGRQVKGEISERPKRASMGFPFSGVNLSTAPALSFALGLRWDQSMEHLASGKIERWVRRALGDTETADAIRDITNFQQKDGVTQDDILARILCLLDPNAPLRYRSVSCRPDSLGGALAMLHGDKERSDYTYQIIRGGLPGFWFKNMERLAAKVGIPVTDIARPISNTLLRGITTKSPNAVIYESNLNWPCQSPRFKDDYVVKLEQLLPALDHYANMNKDIAEDLIDPYMEDFIIARANRDVDLILLEKIREEEEGKERCMAQIRFLAVTQKTFGNASLPHLAGWCGRILAPWVDEVQSKKLQNKISLRLEYAIRMGDLAEVLSVFESNQEDFDVDKIGFEKAKERFQELEEEIQWMGKGGMEKRDFLAHNARSASAIFSFVVTGITILAASVLIIL